MKSDYVDRDTMLRLISKMQPANACACSVAMATGLRIDDVLRITTEQLKRAERKSGWLVVVEKKTGKRKRIRLSKENMRKMFMFASGQCVFPNARDPERHRVRSTVWRDVKKAAKKLNIDVQISPHSLRKLYAVEQYEKHGDLRKVQRQLNHDNMSTTLLYAMSKQVTEAGKKKNPKPAPGGVAPRPQGGGHGGRTQGRRKKRP